jgi:hypothetical protein
LKFSAPSAEADGKINLKALEKYISVFLFSLPSALADGAEIFECLNLTAMVETLNFTRRFFKYSFLMHSTLHTI